MKETWTCWTETATKQIEEQVGLSTKRSNTPIEIECFRGTKTATYKFFKANQSKIHALHIGKLILEWVDGDWVDR
jgi:hypothetical protein